MSVLEGVLGVEPRDRQDPFPNAPLLLASVDQHWLDDAPLGENETAVALAAEYPDAIDAILQLLPQTTDATGAAYADDRVFAELHARANAPLFSALSPYLGAGIVGGSLVFVDELARRSADTAIRLLNGADPASVTIPAQLRGQPIFDWREMERWGIPGSRPSNACATTELECGAG